MNRSLLAAWLLLALLLVPTAFVTGRLTTPDDAETTTEVAAEADEQQLWTCPMHPEVLLPSPGSCPKCGMDLVRREAGSDPGPRRIEFARELAELARIETTPVRRHFVTVPVRMVGKVALDETRVRTIAARVAGRLDRLFVDYTGIKVAADDHLVSLYSPELLIAQQELLDARRRFVASRSAATGHENAFLRDSSERGYHAAREKLALWGFDDGQIDAIEQRGSAEDHMLIRSPTTGVVLHKFKDEGDYVQEGTPVYRIADLDRLWIVLEAYEQDLRWLRYGQAVGLTAEALPGTYFTGRISFLAPTVDERTRTVRVRVNVDNPDGLLKPGMFVRGVVQAHVGGQERVLDKQLAGKWISPMHPEVVKDGPGTCDICGMPLVPAEQLGYVDDEQADKPLVVPASAVLLTGRRAVVYVQVVGKSKPTFEGREVVLGARAGDEYIVLDGLAENELVVVHGAFRVDSAMQIQAKPSMMSMPGDAATFLGPDTAKFRAALTPFYRTTLALQEALAGDDLAAARAAVTRSQQALDDVADATLPATAASHWAAERHALANALRDAASAEDVEPLRRAFEDVSRATLTLVRTFGHADDAEYVEAFCPMAFDDQGAAWLQRAGKLRNPYFGAQMLHCGEFRQRFTAIGSTDDGEHDHDHDHDHGEKHK